MFVARLTDAVPLLNLALPEDAFETENGQVDGTLAHTVERIFAVSAVAAGSSVDSRANSTEPDYPYAKRIQRF
jgi:lipopolysaccharide biosynthesis protein